MYILFHIDKNALKSVASESEIGKSDTLQDANEEIEPVAGPSNPTPIAENINEYELNDSDSEADVSIYDDYLPIVENINEYTFDSDWESENDIDESLALSGKSMTNPALSYMLEYSGLTQNQIIHLIKRNKDENHKTASKSVKVAAKDSTELTEVTKPMDDESITLPENCEKVLELQDMKDTCTTEKNMAIESTSSNSESNNLEVEPLKDNVETLNIITSDILSSDEETILEKRASPATKSNDVTQMDTSDSDSDDFIEIQDVPIHDMNISRNINNTNRKNIEITFKSDIKPEDDMFADIFEEVHKAKVAPMSPKQVHFVDAVNGEHQTQLISEDSNNLKDNFLATIPEESINGETETKSPENIQLSENISNDENKIRDIQNSDKSIEQNNTDTPTQVNPLDECTQEKPVVLPINKEDLTELKVNNIIPINK